MIQFGSAALRPPGCGGETAIGLHGQPQQRWDGLAGLPNGAPASAAVRELLARLQVPARPLAARMSGLRVDGTRHPEHRLLIAAGGLHSDPLPLRARLQEPPALPTLRRNLDHLHYFEGPAGGTVLVLGYSGAPDWPARGRQQAGEQPPAGRLRPGTRPHTASSLALHRLVLSRSGELSYNIRW